MLLFLSAPLLLLLATPSLCQSGAGDSSDGDGSNPLSLMLFEGTQGLTNLVQDSATFVQDSATFGSLAFNSSNGMLFNQRNRRQCSDESMRGHFPCTYRETSEYPPVSVHALRPGDIRVVGAMGDSITAGTGALAEDIKQILTEYVGVAFSIGGESTWETYLTLPNILKNFNPQLYGYSTGTRSINSRAQRHLNFAETGGTTKSLVAQAHKVVARLNRDPHVDVKRDWKMLTILVGHNDICSHACRRFDPFDEPESARPKDYVRKLQKALDILHNGLPRTFINLLPVARIADLLRMYDKPLPCVFTHKYGCPCLFDDEFSHKLSEKQLFRLMNDYLGGMRQLINSGRYDTRDDFTVVIQPTVVNAMSPTYRPRRGARKQPDPDYLAPDCFHWAQKSHAIVARGLWNNLLQPVGSKTSADFTLRTPFLCPTEEFPYLATAKNSKSRHGRDTSLQRDFFRTMQDMGGSLRCPI